ncbi:MAG: hypothetical protein HQ594_07060 [Candidatus Omnitrophica bacterium]|nr:hypothetical protein [Candidatus Omnitrophota bacterium]
MGRLNPPQLLILSFLCAILIGTVLLTLPVATQGAGRLSAVDSLFTATSATCVTGLCVKDISSTFTLFGKSVIFILFQIGGLGIMTFSTLFAVMLGRKLGFLEADTIKVTLDNRSIMGIKKLIFYILGITMAAETIGAAGLFFRWRIITDWGVFETLKRAVFHSVSGFCNAGFSLFSDSLMKFEPDPFINLIMISLIFFGGIGFIVIMDILGFFRKTGGIRRVSLQTKMVLIVSITLILFGAISIFVFEKNNILAAMSMPQRLWGVFFQSVTARTAGFNTLPIAEFTIPSLLVLIFLMFIGASPGSTGGGIKTCTFALVAAAVYAMFKNQKRVMMFGRTFPRHIIRHAFVIFFLALSWIFVFTIVITYLRNGNTASDGTFISSLFEVVSAFGTVGLSTGITPDLDSISKLCITATMFAGRLGPLTLILAVAFRETKESFVYPEESVMVG